jgi:hypothetical protein
MIFGSATIIQWVCGWLPALGQPGCQSCILFHCLTDVGPFDEGRLPKVDVDDLGHAWQSSCHTADKVGTYSIHVYWKLWPYRPVEMFRYCYLVLCQVLHCHQLPTARLMLVAPSNLAADMLAERLLKTGCPKSSMMRVCAFSRTKEDLKPEVLNVSLWDDANKCFRCGKPAQVPVTMYNQMWESVMAFVQKVCLPAFTSCLRSM